MTHWKRTGSIFAAVIALASGLLLLEAPDLEAHGRHGRRPVFVSRSYGPHFGLGFGPGGAFGPWGAYGYWGGPWGGDYPGQGVDTMTVAKMTGWGALELSVKPSRADVWVDGKYVGEARDLDGYPSYLWLEKGAHRLAIYEGGYRTFEEDVEVERGVLKDLKVRLEPGNSLPPGPKPSDKKEQDEKDRGNRKGDQTD